MKGKDYHMTINDVPTILHGSFICGEEHAEREIHSACGSDMMSDVLAYVKDQAVLLTGLCNPQVIRTAEMIDIYCIVFIRGKKPTEEMIEMAKERDIAIICTDHRMFNACGMLYDKGLRGGKPY